METAQLNRPQFWDSRESFVLAPERLGRQAAELEAKLGQEEWIVFATSGTSGAPKWIALRRESLLASARSVNAHLAADASDVWMLTLPTYHVGGFGVVARAFASGARVRSFPGRWDAIRFAHEVQEFEVTLTSLVPTQVHDLVECGLHAPPSLRAVVVGGARLREDIGQAARDLGWPVLASFGMTEAASQIATASLEQLDDDYRVEPLPVLPHWEHAIDSEGRLRIRGPAVFDAYLSVSEGALSISDPKVEGWFTTSDFVAEEDGGLTFAGRSDRRIKVLGEMVDLHLLEEELREHVSADVVFCIVAVEEERRGWRLIPVVEETSAMGFADVVDLINRRQPGFARLDQPAVVTNLPRSPLGKIDATTVQDELRRRQNS